MTTNKTPVINVLLSARRTIMDTAERNSQASAESFLAVLAEASSAMRRATSPMKVKRIALNAAMQICETESAAWWDNFDGNLTGPITIGSKSRCVRLRRIPADVFIWNDEKIKEDLVNLSIGRAEHAQLLARAGAQNGLLVRAHYEGNDWAALGIFDGDYGVARINALTTLAQQAAAFARALELSSDQRLMAEVQHQLVSELGFALSSALSLGELLDLLCRSAIELVSADDCVIYLAEPEESEFTLKSITNHDLQDLPEVSLVLKELAEQARERPLANPLWRTGSGRGGLNNIIRQAGYQSLLGVGLWIRGDPLGSILLISKKPHAFTKTQREIILTFAAQAAVAIENLQLVEDMQRRLLEMADLTWVSTRVTSTMELDQIAATVTEATSKALDVPLVSLLLVDESGRFKPLPRGQFGISDYRDIELPSSGHIGEEAITIGVPQVLTDVMREGRQEDAIVRLLGARSLLCVPMTVQQGLRGLFVIGDKRPREYPSHSIALLSAYANQTALALQSAMLYQDIVRHLKQLEKLIEVSRTLASSLELTETLDRVLEVAGDLLNAPVGNLMLMDSDNEELSIKAARGLRPSHEFHRPIKVGEGLAGRAAQAQIVLASADIQKDGRYSRRDLARIGRLKVALSVPLIVRKRTVGVLNLFRSSSQEFTEEEQRLAVALAHSASVAIENARLYEESQERAQFLTAMVSEINHRVRNTLQAVAGLLRMEMEQDPPHSIHDVLRRGIARLQSVAVVHDMMQARDLSFVDMKQAARRIVQLTTQTNSGQTIETRVVGTRVKLPSQRAANVAMVLSELLDNAVRHGLPNVSNPLISVSLSEIGNSIVLEVEDNGIGLPEGFDLDRDARLGLQVVRGLIAEELKGTLSIESNKGMKVRAKFPKHG